MVARNKTLRILRRAENGRGRRVRERVGVGLVKTDLTGKGRVKSKITDISIIYKIHIYKF